VGVSVETMREIRGGVLDTVVARFVEKGVLDIVRVDVYVGFGIETFWEGMLDTDMRGGGILDIDGVLVCVVVYVILVDRKGVETIQGMQGGILVAGSGLLVRWCWVFR
jgi:hypothetical protein